MVRALVQALTESGHEVECAYPTFASPYSLHRHSRSDFGCPAIELPAVHFLVPLQFGLPALAYPRVTEAADVHLGVGGTSLCGIPTAIAGGPFALWLATSFRDEWRSRRGRHGVNPYRVANGALLPLIEWLECTVLRRSARVLAISRYVADSVRSLSCANPASIDVLPIPIGRWNDLPGPEERDEDRVLFVGRVDDPRKDVDTLLDAFTRLAAEGTAAELVLVGDYEEGGHIARRIDQASWGVRVHLTGRVSEERKWELLRSAAVLVVCSRQEGLGLTAVEALAAGTPVVSTACGGTEEIVGLVSPELIVPVGDAEALAEKIGSLLRGELLTEAEVKAGRTRVRKRYEFKTFRQRADSLVRELAAGGAS